MKQGGNPSGGFTLVETMIVLAVTGGLFVSAVALINGRQNKTMFTTAINDTVQQVQQIINETASGYYPNNNNLFNCTIAAGKPLITAPGASPGQGSNTDCVFLGKVMQFGVGANPEQYAVHSIAGLRSANDVVSAMPTDIYTATLTNELISQNMENGLTAVSMTYTDTSGGVHQTAGAAFLAGDDSGNIATTNASGSLNSGSQQISLYGVTGTNVGVGGDTIPSMAAKINLTLPTTFQHAQQIQICLLSGTTDQQSGLITIGNPTSGSSLTVTLAIKGNNTCA